MRDSICRGNQHKEPESKYLAIEVDWNLSAAAHGESLEHVAQCFLISRGVEEKWPHYWVIFPQKHADFFFRLKTTGPWEQEASALQATDLRDYTSYYCTCHLFSLALWDVRHGNSARQAVWPDPRCPLHFPAWLWWREIFARDPLTPDEEGSRFQLQVLHGPHIPHSLWSSATPPPPIPSTTTKGIPSVSKQRFSEPNYTRFPELSLFPFKREQVLLVKAAENCENILHPEWNTQISATYMPVMCMRPHSQPDSLVQRGGNECCNLNLSCNSHIFTRWKGWVKSLSTQRGARLYMSINVCASGTLLCFMKNNLQNKSLALGSFLKMPLQIS